MRPLALWLLGAAILLLLAIVGCGAGGGEGPTSPTPPVDYSTFTEDTTMSATTGAITGRIVDEAGDPIAEATVTITVRRGRQASATSFTTTTDADGWYRIGNVPQGTYSLTMSRSGYTTATVDVTVTTSNVTDPPDTTITATGDDIVVIGGGTGSIFGKVTDASDIDVGVADAYVYVPLAAPGHRATEVIAHDKSQTDGSYALENLPGGTQAVRVSAPTGANYGDMQVELTVPEGADVQLNITLLPTAYEGRVAAIILDPASATVGNSDALQFTATVLDYSAETLSLTPTWVVSPSVGTITPEGLLTAGTVEADGFVLTYIGSKTASAPVAVRPRQLQVASSVDFETTETTKTLSIAYTGAGALQWSVAEQIDWLTVAPTSGSAAADLALTVDRSGLSAENAPYTGTLSITSDGGNQDVTVTCHMNRMDYDIE